jgi:hypothetical protein
MRIQGVLMKSWKKPPANPAQARRRAAGRCMYFSAQMWRHVVSSVYTDFGCERKHMPEKRLYPDLQDSGNMPDAYCVFRQSVVRCATPYLSESAKACCAQSQAA